MDSRQVRNDVTGANENLVSQGRKNPFLRAPAVALGAALFLGGTLNFILPFASFGMEQTVGSGKPEIMSNGSRIPRLNFPSGVCIVEDPKDDFKPTMNSHNKAKE